MSESTVIVTKNIIRRKKGKGSKKTRDTGPIPKSASPPLKEPDLNKLIQESSMRITEPTIQSAKVHKQFRLPDLAKNRKGHYRGGMSLPYDEVRPSENNTPPPGKISVSVSTKSLKASHSHSVIKGIHEHPKAYKQQWSSVYKDLLNQNSGQIIKTLREMNESKKGLLTKRYNNKQIEEENRLFVNNICEEIDSEDVRYLGILNKEHGSDIINASQIDSNIDDSSILLMKTEENTSLDKSKLKLTGDEGVIPEQRETTEESLDDDITSPLPPPISGISTKHLRSNNISKKLTIQRRKSKRTDTFLSRATLLSSNLKGNEDAQLELANLLAKVGGEGSGDCKYCPHCKLQKGELYKVKQTIKGGVNDAIFYEGAATTGVEGTRRMNMGKNITRRDSLLFENSLDMLMKKELKIEDMLDKETFEEIRNADLYKGMIVKDWNKLLTQLKNIDFAPTLKSERVFARYTNHLYKKHYLKAQQARTSNLTKNLNVDMGSLDPASNRKPSNTQLLDSYKFSLQEGQKVGEKSETIYSRFIDFQSEYNKKFPQSQTKVDNFDSEDTISMVLYIGLQEILKQLMVTNKEKGRLLLKMFREYFNKNEEKWFKVVNGLVDQLLKQKAELAYLLAQNLTGIDDVETILTNNEVSVENLAEHKRLLNQVIGAYNNEETKRIDAENKIKYVNGMASKWIYDWERIHHNIDMLKSLEKIDDTMYKARFQADPTLKLASQDEISILINAERLLMLIPFPTRWETERNDLKAQFDVLSHKYKETKEQYENDENLVRHLKTELHTRTAEKDVLAQALDFANNQLDITETNERGTITDLNLKDLAFVENAKLIYEEKKKKESLSIQEIIKRVQSGVSSVEPAPKKEILETNKVLFSMLFLQFNSTSTNIDGVKFEDVFYNYISKRYVTKKDINKKCENLLKGIMKYRNKDDRLEIFANIIGLDRDNGPSSETLKFYLGLIKSTGEVIEDVFSRFCNIFLDSKLYMKKIRDVIPNANRTHINSVRLNIIRESFVYIDGIVQENLSAEEITYYLILSDLSAKLSFLSKAELTKIFDTESETLLYYTTKEKFRKFIQENVTSFELDYSEIDKIYLRKFLIKHDNIIFWCDLEKVFAKKYELKILLTTYLRVGLAISIKFIIDSQDILKEIFLKFNATEALTEEQFKSILIQLFPTRPQWQLNAILEEAFKEKSEEVNFEGFLQLILNNPLLKGIGNSYMRKRESITQF